MRISIVTTVADGPGRGRSIAALLASTQQLNEAFLRWNPELPWLYESGVRYQREPAERLRKEGEEFAAIPIVYPRGWGDCDDLAPWRAAELRVRRGIPAYAAARRTGPSMWHAIVTVNGREIDDPSRVLGMGRRRPEDF